MSNAFGKCHGQLSTYVFMYSYSGVLSLSDNKIDIFHHVDSVGNCN